MLHGDPGAQGLPPAAATLGVRLSFGGSTFVGAAPMVTGDIKLHTVNEEISLEESKGWKIEETSGLSEDAEEASDISEPGKGGLTGGFQRVMNRVKKWFQATGSESLTIDTGIAYIYEVDVDAEITGVERRLGRKSKTHRPDPVRGNKAVYLLPERIALQAYLDGELAVPLEQIADVITRFGNGSLELDGALALELLTRYRDELAAAGNPDLPHLPDAQFDTAEGLAAQLDEQLLDLFSHVTFPDDVTTVAQRVDFLLDQTPGASEEQQLPDYLSEALGPTGITHVALRDEHGLPVDLAEQAMQIVESVVPGRAQADNPLLGTALYTQLAGKRWVGQVDSILRKRGLTLAEAVEKGVGLPLASIPIYGRFGQLKGEVEIDLVGMLSGGERGHSSATTGQIGQHYRYQGVIASWRKAKAYILNIAGQLGGIVGLGGEHKRDRGMTVSVTNTQMDRESSFAGTDTWNQRLELTLNARFRYATEPGRPISNVWRWTGNLVSGSRHSMMTSVHGAVSRLVPKGVLQPADPPNAAKHALTDPRATRWLPEKFKLHKADFGSLDEAVIRRLGKRDLFGRRKARAVSREVRRRFAGMAFDSALRKFLAPGGHQLAEIPMPGDARTLIRIRIEGTDPHDWRREGATRPNVEQGGVHREHETATDSESATRKFQGSVDANRADGSQKGGVSASATLGDEVWVGDRDETSDFQRGWVSTASAIAHYHVTIEVLRRDSDDNRQVVRTVRLPYAARGRFYGTMLHEELEALRADMETGRGRSRWQLGEQQEDASRLQRVLRTLARHDMRRPVLALEELLPAASQRPEYQPDKPGAALAQEIRARLGRRVSDASVVRVRITARSATYGPHDVDPIQIARSVALEGIDVQLQVREAGSTNRVYGALPSGDLVSPLPDGGFVSARRTLDPELVRQANREGVDLRQVWSEHAAFYDSFTAAVLSQLRNPPDIYGRELPRPKGGARGEGAAAVHSSPAPGSGASVTDTEVPGTRHANTRGTADPAAVEERLPDAMQELVDSGMVAEVQRQGHDTYQVTPHKGRSFTVRVTSGHLEPKLDPVTGELRDVLARTMSRRDTAADVIRGRRGHGPHHVVVSDRAPDSEIDAAVAHEIRETIARNTGRLTRLRNLVSSRSGPDVLRVGGEPHGKLTPEDEGRIAQLRILAHKLVETTDPAEVAALERDLAGTIDHLGLNESTPGSDGRRNGIAPHLPAYAMDLVVALGGARVDAADVATIERMVTRQLAGHAQGVVVEPSPHGVEVLVEDASRNVFQVMVTSGESFNETAVRIAASRTGDRYVVRLPRGARTLALGDQIATQLQTVLDHRQHGVPLNPPFDAWAATHPHHYHVLDPTGARVGAAGPEAERLAEEQASLANQLLANLREQPVTAVTLNKTLTALSRWRLTFATEQAYLDPDGTNPYRENRSRRVRRALSERSLALAREGVLRLDELRVMHGGVRPGDAMYRRAVTRFADAAYDLLRDPLLFGQEDVVRTFLIAVHTDVFGHPVTLPEFEHRWDGRREFTEWFRAQLASRAQTPAATAAEKMLRAVEPALADAGVDLATLAPPEARMMSNPGWRALVDALSTLPFPRQHARDLVVAAIKFAVDNGGVQVTTGPDGSTSRTVRLPELAGLVGYYGARLESGIEDLSYRLRPGKFSAYGRRRARSALTDQARQPTSEFHDQLRRMLERDRRMAETPGRGEVGLDLPHTGVSVTEMRTALREQIGTIGFASATAGAFHAQNPANAIANLVDAIDPADPSSNIARYYRALDNTLRNSDRVTLHRLPDGVVRVVAQRVAHDQDGALLHRRGNPVTISATILLRPAQDGVLATVESLQARPDRSMRGHGQPLASRKRVLEAVAATESGLAVEVDAETLFPALDKPNTIVIKPLGADAFDAAVDFDSQTGKLVVTAAGMTVHTSVNAAKNAPDGQLLRAVEAALADAVAQLQAKKLGRPESAFSIENVLRA
ncbi:MAG: hypothetical protein ACRDT1_01465, partial [Micromonosporaceae bacterium]